MAKVEYLVSRRGQQYAVIKRVTFGDGSADDWEADISCPTMYREIARTEYDAIMARTKEKHWAHYAVQVADDDKLAAPYDRPWYV